MTGAEKIANPWPIAVAVSLATFMEVLDTTITNVSLSHISGSLGADQNESTWVLTSYLVANGIILPLSGWLSNVMGRRKFFLMCIAGFTAASFACGAATSLGMLVFFRVLQGLAGGGLQPTQQAIMIDIFPADKRGQAFALTGLTIIVAPILGPTLGGWITDNLDWRWIFYINLPVGILAFTMVGRLLHDSGHSVARGLKSVDYTGLGLIALGLGCLQIMLDKGQQEDWFQSGFIVALAAASAFCLVSAVFRLLRQADPVVDLRLLKDRSFAVCCALIFFTGFVLFSSSALLPLLVQGQFGYDATLAGLVLSPGGLVVGIMMPLAGKISAKVDARKLIILGLFCCGLGMWQMAAFTPGTDYGTFAFLRVVQMAGLPFLFIPVSTTAFARIPREQGNKASSLYSLFRNLGGSFGIALVSTLVVRRSQAHQTDLVAHLVPGNPAYDAAMAAPGGAGMVWHGLLQQANLLAYRDSFMLMAVVMGVGIALTLLLPKTVKPAADIPVH